MGVTSRDGEKVDVNAPLNALVGSNKNEVNTACEVIGDVITTDSPGLLVAPTTAIVDEPSIAEDEKEGVAVVSTPMLVVGVTIGVVVVADDCSRDTEAKNDDDVISWVDI